MKRTIALLTLLLAFLPSVLTAQTAKSEIILVYADDELEMTILDATGNPLVAKEGMSIPIGSVITTKNTTAELQLRPNKSIIKLANKTTFQIKGLIDGKNATNDFALTAGKIRTVAAKLTGAKGPAYTISTPTANCGVRGTDFAMKYDLDSKLDWVCVQEGTVDFTNVLTGATVPVTTGQFANTFDAVFGAAPVSADRLAELFSDIGFVKLNPTDVPGKEIATTTQEKPAETTNETAAPEAAPEPDSPFMTFLKQVFGMEVGSVTIAGTTYSKAVLSPVFKFDSVKLGLYLPVIYTSDMFDPDDWYHPRGNDEWSFGSDKSGSLNIAADALNDFALKIKFLEIGVQNRDPFYLKVGNLNTMSLGHGTVVRNFANDQDFPSVRKIGLNAGVKFGGTSFEGLVDDVALPSVVGGRIAFDIAGDQVALGFQTTADLSLADDQNLTDSPLTAEDLGKPVLLVGGVDLQVFRIKSDFINTVAFADFNTMAVYYRSEPNQLYFPELKQGLDISPAYHKGLGSFGTEAGFDGNISLVNFRLSFQTQRGLYQNALFQGNYYRVRNVVLFSALDYTNASEEEKDAIDKTLTMGIYGEAGFDVGIFSLNGAYLLPFELRGNGSIGPSESDSVKIGVVIPKGKIPFVPLSGGLSYERAGFIQSIKEKADLFDASTVFKGDVTYGLTKGLDLVVGIVTSVLREANGDVVYTSSGKPKVGPTVTIDTKISL